MKNDVVVVDCCKFMIICHECCWVYVGDDNSCIDVDKCVVVKLLCFYHFFESGLKLEKFDFDEFEWINGIVMIIRIIRIFIFDQRFWVRNRLGENRIFISKAVLSTFVK